MSANGLTGMARGFSASEAAQFHEASKLPPRVPKGQIGDQFPRVPAEALTPTPSRVYRTGTPIALPPLVALATPLTDVLANRLSTRDYDPVPLELGHLGQVLGWSYGVTARTAGESRRSYGRPVPSGGGLYPIEVYVAATRVEGLATGVYHYDPHRHQLASVSTDGGFDGIYESSLYPEIVMNASAIFVLVAVFPRTCGKYGERGYRFALLDCGHVAQNLHLVAGAVGLGTVGLGGFLDDGLNRLLELDGTDEAVLHTMAIGWPIPVAKERIV